MKATLTLLGYEGCPDHGLRPFVDGDMAEPSSGTYYLVASQKEIPMCGGYIITADLGTIFVRFGIRDEAS